MPLNAHWLVHKQARAMAAELFEIYARDNATYAALRQRGEITEKQARRIFVAQVAPKLYEDARGALTACLAEPDDKIPVTLKNQIAEALIQDNDCRGNRLVARERATVPRRLH